MLTIVIALLAWSLHLMQQAYSRREFSLLLAGILVAFSAAAMVAVYLLMSNYVGYVTHMAHHSQSLLAITPSTAETEAHDWVIERDSSAVSAINLAKP